MRPDVVVDVVSSAKATPQKVFFCMTLIFFEASTVAKAFQVLLFKLFIVGFFSMLKIATQIHTKNIFIFANFLFLFNLCMRLKDSLTKYSDFSNL